MGEWGQIEMRWKGTKRPTFPHSSQPNSILYSSFERGGKGLQNILEAFYSVDLSRKFDLAYFSFSTMAS
jgi:hypothetical protein